MILDQKDLNDLHRANLYNTHHASLDSIPLEILEPEKLDKDTVVKYANWLKYRIDTTGMDREIKVDWNKMNLEYIGILYATNHKKLPKVIDNSRIYR